MSTEYMLLMYCGAQYISTYADKVLYSTAVCS